MRGYRFIKLTLTFPLKVALIQNWFKDF